MAHAGFVPDEAAGAYTVLWKYHPTYAAGIARPPLIIRVVDDSPHKAYQQDLNITFCRKFIRATSSSDASFVLAHEVTHYMLRHGELVWGWMQAGQVTGQINGVSYTFPYHEITCQHSLDMVINDGLMTNAGMPKPTIEMIEPQPGDFMLGEANVYVREYKHKLEEAQKEQEQKKAQGNRPTPPSGKGDPGKGKPQPLPGDPSNDGVVPDNYNKPGPGPKDGQPCNGNTKGQYPTKSLLSCEDLAGACLPQDPADIDQVKQQDIIRKFIEELAEKGQGKYSAMVERLTMGLEPVKEDWRKVIRPRVVSAVGRDRETWARYNQTALMVKSHRPAYEGRRAGRVGLAFDTSGSMGGVEQRIMLNAFCDMYTQVTPKLTYLFQVDARMQDVTTFRTVAEMRRFIADHVKGDKGLLGGGGSDMRPVNTWLKENNVQLDILVYFTDGYVRYPTSLGNAKRVIWVMTNDQSTAPPEAGETIRFTNPSPN